MAQAALPKMPRRPLGQTGLEVSVLGFGASPLGGVFQASAADFDGAAGMRQCSVTAGCLARSAAPAGH